VATPAQRAMGVPSVCLEWVPLLPSSSTARMSAQRNLETSSPQAAEPVSETPTPDPPHPMGGGRGRVRGEAGQRGVCPKFNLPGPGEQLILASMFSRIKQLAASSQEAVQALLHISALLSSVLERWQEDGDLGGRLEELERSRALWEAEVDALIMRAESTLKAAKNAEMRSKTMAKTYESFFDTVGENGIEALQAAAWRAVPDADGAPGDEEELQSVPLGLEGGKAHATRIKFGG